MSAREPITATGAVIPCPHCGNPMPASEILAVLPGMQGRLYEIVRKAGTAGIIGRDIMSQMYADDPSGGPEGTNIISVFAHHANKKIRRFGVEISTRRGPWSVWRVVNIEGDAS